MKNGLDIYGPFSPVDELLNTIIITDTAHTVPVEGPRNINRWEIFEKMW